MSSEIRVKKLRGSGGYVIAALTDEQQSRASIGGPDLFLAPLCRMDTTKISKHQCTMCDKEFEGSPKIEYENPNEEVAPGLTLVEKGRYTCNTCDSTIAEYREFRKDEKDADTTKREDAPTMPAQVQTASEQVQTASEQVQTASEQPDSTTAPLQVQQPIPEPQQVQQPIPEPQQVQSAAAQSAASQPQEQPSVSTIEGRTVYDENATKAGTVRQIGIDAAGAMTMIVARDDGTEYPVAWSKIRKIGDIVILGDDDALSSTAQQQATVSLPPQAEAEPGVCNKCSFKNREGSKFCEECGAQL